MIKREYLYISIIFFSSYFLGAQDIHFSQYYASPFNLNPALTGLFDGSIRSWGNYRSQWGSVHRPYETYDAGIDFTVPFKSDNFGIGIMALGDMSGNASLSVYKFAMFGSYHKTFGPRKRKHIMAIGYYVKYVQKRIDLHNLTFPSQYNGDYDFDPNLDNGENYLDNQLGFPDVGLGAYWRMNPKYFPKYSFGFSMYHINLPKETFLDDKNRLAMRYHLHGDMLLKVKHDRTLKPRMIIMGQNNNFNIIVGAEYEHFIVNTMKKRTSVFGGAMMRLGDAIVIVGGAEHKNVRLGISYDVNISDLVPASSMFGAIEISLQYIGIFRKFTGVKCPKVPNF